MSSPRIRLDDVDCDGTETSLSQCSSRSWGEHNCGPDADVGVRCTDTTKDPAVPIHKRKLGIDEQNTTGSKYTVRLGNLPSGA